MSTANPFELRSSALEFRVRGRKLEGFAALFGVEARIENRFVESIRQVAFAQTISDGHDILALADHQPDKLLARTSAGSLRLAEDTRGLHFEMDLPATTIANDVLALVESRNAGGMSFGFSAIDEHWQGDRRELRAVALHEISVISSFPAYSGTSVSARSRARAFRRRALARRYLETINLQKRAA